jgi:hypothetical protein
MRIGEPRTSEGELLTNIEMSSEIETIPKQDITSPLSDMVWTHIARFDNNAIIPVTVTSRVESVAKIYYGFTDEQWKPFSSNQKKKHRKNMQRAIQTSGKNS